MLYERFMKICNYIMTTNNDTSEYTDIAKNVIAKIDAKELTMRSRGYFVLRGVVLVLLAFAVLAISVFICNFILFSLRINEHETLLNFGGRGVIAFLSFFPWGLLALDVILIVLLEYLLRRFRFGYRSPVLYLLIGLLVLTVSVGLFVDRATDVNDRLMRRAHQHTLPAPFNDYYDHARQPIPEGSGVCRCVITSIDGDTIIVYNEDVGSSSILSITLSDDEHETVTALRVGDTIMIAGDESDRSIHAYGIRKLQRP